MSGINLHLGICHDSDIEKIVFNDHKEMLDYINEIDEYYQSDRLKGVWLFTTSSEFGEIIVTENIEVILSFMKFCEPYCLSKNEKGFHYHLFLQESFESCYRIASDMREGNPLCYDKV